MPAESVPSNVDFDRFFALLSGLATPRTVHPWQRDLALNGACINRQIRIPTGFGKTFGVLAAWLWNRVHLQSPAWPRRLVWCLPMRVLVEQMQSEVEAALRRLGSPASEIRVHALIGGHDAADWHLEPEREAVLIGTQDMLLSRALNRGYAAGRARWPMDFGLLNVDCLWVMDEVQLMDVGLATSTQLQSFREQEAAGGRMPRPCRTWWMSATLQSSWLLFGPDAQAHLQDLPRTSIPPLQRIGPLWDSDRVAKPLEVTQVADARTIAALVARMHGEEGLGAKGPTLVVLNRVELAVEVHRHLSTARQEQLAGADLRLVHSRFRPADRSAWRAEFLSRESCTPGNNRIIVSTQVVEAGVDISAGLLFTEIAPWPSLVQRFGRCARWGGTARVVVLDTAPATDKAALPYARLAIDAARSALGYLRDVAPLHLEAFEEAHPAFAPELYPYSPGHLLLRHELDELFDTEADLCGADTDISRFIRSGDERDVQVFWRSLRNEDLKAGRRISPTRDELCAVPFLAARRWLCPDDKPARRAWIWDWLDGAWVAATPARIYPGQTLLVHSDHGGYDPVLGWSPGLRTSVLPGDEGGDEEGGLAERADAAEADESLSIAGGWQTIAFHGAQVGRRARELARTLIPDLEPLFDMAGRWHDAGKIHPAFQACLQPHAHGIDIAKAPESAWVGHRQLYRVAADDRRQGFRHELASTLALLALMRRCRPDHAALLGPWRGLLQHLSGAADETPAARAADQRPLPLSPIEQEIVALDAHHFDLLLYLVCTHHGKVRMSWHSSPADQAARDTVPRIRGVRSGDLLPEVTLTDSQGHPCRLPPAEMVLAAAGVGLNPHTGQGWTERVLNLLRRHGPLTLAWLEGLIRAADQQATRDRTLADPSLEAHNGGNHGLDGSHHPMAGVARRGEAAPALGEHPAQRGGQLRLRGGTGGSGDAGSRTRAPSDATRYIETRQGVLSYQELAPHLALAVARVERQIEAGGFDESELDEHLIADLHRRLCAEMTPQLLGWRRSGVVVGTHTPPEPFQVPMLMREYALDLGARFEDASRNRIRWTDALAFAEGRLLSIHPFADFNGRTTRLFLRLILHRQDLPLVDLLPSAGHEDRYFQALRAGDRKDWMPLREVWRERFEGSGSIRSKASR